MEELLVLRHFLLLLVFFSGFVFSENRPLPYSSILGHTGTDKNGIEFECRELSGNPDSIMCDFVQVLLRKKLDEKDLIEENSKGIKAVRKELKKNGYQSLVNDGVCKILDSNDLPTYAHVNEFISLLKNRCPVSSEKSANDLLAEVVVMNNRYAVNTCNVYLNKWSHKFKYQRTDDYWVSSSGPNGICGAIYISTLKSTEGILWEFTTKKIVTNKDNKDGLIACSELDESEQLYSWKSEPKPFECKYLDF